MKRRWLLPILTTVMGMQLMRVFIPSLAWYLRDTVGLPSLTLAPYAFGTFLAAFLAVLLRRLAGSSNAVRIAALLVAAMRLLEQFSRSAQLDLWSSIVGVAAFLIFLPLYLGHLRAAAEPAVERWALGIPLGLALDVALHGANGTLDFSWAGGAVPLVVVIVIAVLSLWSAASLDAATGDSETSWAQALPLIGIGPLILVELTIFESSGWVEEIAGIPAPLGLATVMVGNLVLILGAWFALSRPHRFDTLMAFGAVIYLPLITYSAITPGVLFVVSVVVTQLVLGWGWGVVCRRAAQATRPGLGRTGTALPIGTLLFLALAFAYYLALDLALPVPRNWVLPIGALMFGLAVLAASRGAQPPPQPSGRQPVWAAAALLLVPVLLWLLQRPAPESETGAAPLRIMTYNIHSGFGAAGAHDPEQVAQAIEDSGADIVALQEVSRVRLMDSGTDLAEWLSRRLGFPYVFHGHEEPIWGNAILSRYPILDWGWDELPRQGALIGRGYIWAEIDVGFRLLVVNAHLHHIEEDHDIRLVEVPVLMDFWGQRPATVLLGDLNAEPDYPEMALPAEAGLIDSWGEAGDGPGYTWSADDPFKRIDWIWHSPDLRATNIQVVDTQASDHRPVVADIEPLP